MPEPLIPKHGGYRKLKTFQLAELLYDLTTRFCDEHVDRRSRTHDQMVQAARSGVQNVVEGSQASGTSKKTEMKLTNVARASLEELRRDYTDFLRQRGLAPWAPHHPALMRFKARRCSTTGEFGEWVAGELRRKNTDQHGRTQTGTDEHGRRPRTRSSAPVRVGPCAFVSVRGGPCRSVSVRVAPSAELAANGLLSLLNLCCYLLDRQLTSQAAAFEQEGGFSERLYRLRSERRRNGGAGR